jgi:hypothetical protein
MASVNDYNWTHLRSDPCHYEDDLRITTGAGRYRLGNPANGTQGVFVPEPTTRLQTWGQSQIVTQQKTDVESDLFNINRPTTKAVCGSYNPETNKFNKMTLTAMPEASFPQSHMRLNDPPCTLRDSGWNRFEWLCENPQQNVMMPFDWFVPGRLLSKDSHRACIPTPTNTAPSLPTPVQSWSDPFFGKSESAIARQEVAQISGETRNSWTAPKTTIDCPAPVSPPSVSWRRPQEANLPRLI